MTLETDIHDLIISRKNMVAMWMLIISIVVISLIVFSISTKPIDVMNEVKQARADVMILQGRIDEIVSVLKLRDTEIHAIEKEVEELKKSIQVDSTQP